MTLNFHKYHGTGNDFILIDNRMNDINLSTDQIEQMCSRRFGIGADGLMLLESSTSHDFKMVYYNADGQEGSMCGNGGRCIIAFAKKLEIIKNTAHFIAVDGEHTGTINDKEVCLKMNVVDALKSTTKGIFLNTGSPHLVAFVKNIRNYNVKDEGRKLRYDTDISTNGTNVNFVERLNQDSIFVRTYERGVEDETYSCGTGVVASAIAYTVHYNIPINHINIETLGGNLRVNFEKNQNASGFSNILLTGPTSFVYTGIINI